MSPIIRQLHTHPIRVCLSVMALYAPFVWALTSVHGVLS